MCASETPGTTLSHLSEKQWDTLNDTKPHLWAALEHLRISGPLQEATVWHLRQCKATFFSGSGTREVMQNHSNKQQWNIWNDTEKTQEVAVRKLGHHRATQVRGSEKLRMTWSHLNDSLWKTWDNADTQWAEVKHLVTGINSSEWH